MARRQTEGAETWRRLLNWDRGQTASERLAAHVLRCAGYTSVDPSHPLGGRDGLKDVLCIKDGEKWVGAAYFPRGQRSFSDIQSKFLNDVQGVSRNDAVGLAFVTNQELQLAQRDQLKEEASPAKLDLFHLERIASLLDSPACYGVRLEYLDIEMTKEEQLAFIAVRDQAFDRLQEDIRTLSSRISQSDELREDFERIRTGQVPKERSRVTPVPLSNPLTGRVLGEDRVHRCSNCGYGYIVKGHGIWAATVGQPMAVTCPNCGNVDRFYSS